MPNYDIIPLAVDLLDYTIQRVKTKEPEYRKIKALVQENGQLAERELFEKIRDDGKPHFPKSQTFHLCARLEECATTILEKCISADGRYFETDFETGSKTLMPCWLPVTPCSSTSTSVSRKSTSRVTSATIGRSSSARYGKKPLVGAAMTETVRRLCVRQSAPRNLLK